jgi:26S proteasome regulatory subunit N9
LYNFGELLTHPILESLLNSPHAWLRTLLLQYNSGDLEGFEKLVKTGDFLKQPLLVNSIAFLRQKLCLMTLVESVFKRSKQARSGITFADISRETRVNLEDVEHLVMKALSLGLIKGSIDEASSTVNVSWVQPRVLNKAQILTIRDRLAEWSTKVHGRVTDLEKEQVFHSLLVQ